MNNEKESVKRDSGYSFSFTNNQGSPDRFLSPVSSGRTSPRMNLLNSLAMQLFDAGIVKFGEFRLRSGAISPIYFDLRLLITNPTLIKRVVDQYIMLSDLESDGPGERRVCG